MRGTVATCTTNLRFSISDFIHSFDEVQNHGSSNESAVLVTICWNPYRCLCKKSWNILDYSTLLARIVINEKYDFLSIFIVAPTIRDSWNLGSRLSTNWFCAQGLCSRLNHKQNLCSSFWAQNVRGLTFKKILCSNREHKPWAQNDFVLTVCAHGSCFVLKLDLNRGGLR